MSQPVCTLCGQPAVLVWLKFSTSADNNLANVFACSAHQLSIDVACLTHQSTCTAPNTANLPLCDCQPTNTDVSAIAHAN